MFKKRLLSQEIKPGLKLHCRV